MRSTFIGADARRDGAGGNGMTRAEHLAWAKERALEYLDRGDLPNAFASMCSDMRKHPELGINPSLAMLALLYVRQRDALELRKWIEGFN